MWSQVSSKVFLSSLNNIINHRNDIIDVQLKIFFQIRNFFQFINLWKNKLCYFSKNYSSSYEII